jgi:hypothetical protein
MTERLASMKMQNPEMIEALFTVAGGDIQLVERAFDSSAEILDPARVLRAVEYIIAHRNDRTCRYMYSRSKAA